MDKLLLDLRHIIEFELLHLIDNDYIFYGLPYYSNIGDVLIWEGTRQLLSKCNYNCLDSYASSSRIRKKVSKETVIIIAGGGFWGDVWRNSFEYVLSNIENKYDNRIIFLPNSIFYKDKSLLERDVNFLNKFKDLYICCRDSFSYNYAKSFFSNKVLLVPDMAFYIDPISLVNFRQPCTGKTLMLQRNDCEVNDSIILRGANVHDWPTMEYLSFSMFIYKSLFRVYFFLTSFPFFDTFFFRRLVNFIGFRFFRKYMLRVGVGFITKYNTIVTTRLHPMILAFLLNKKVFFIDNSYGKISHLYDTWLQDSMVVSKYTN